jgi:hypothetical protein
MTFIRAVLLLTLAWTPLAAQAPVERTNLAGTVRQGRLSFDGRATTGGFSGTTTSVTGEMHGGGLTALRGWVEAPDPTLVTGNQRSDRYLNK